MPRGRLLAVQWRRRGGACSVELRRGEVGRQVCLADVRNTLVRREVAQARGKLEPSARGRSRREGTT